MLADCAYRTEEYRVALKYYELSGRNLPPLGDDDPPVKRKRGITKRSLQRENDKRVLQIYLNWAKAAEKLGKYKLVREQVNSSGGIGEFSSV